MAVALTSASTAEASNAFKYYISVTSMQVPFFNFHKFAWYSFPCVPQAKKTPGNVSTGTTACRSFYYTLTVWESRESMVEFLRSGAHIKAIRQSRKIGIFGQTYGYETNDIPNWNEAITLLQEKGRIHYDYREKYAANKYWSRLVPYLLLTAAVLAALGLTTTKLLDIEQRVV
ncbi:hypothetical protein MPSEU_000018400 [Mayamaea pseudoterrestris]|nr:hypothetical protein MPSEU_000018400 [Mayamaea pseudoterrestris]